MEVRPLPLRRHLRVVRREEALPGSEGASLGAYHRNRHLINPFNFLLAAVALLLITGPLRRETWIAITTVALFMAYLRVRVWQIAAQISLRREAPTRAREKDPIRVQIRVRHLSAFLTPRIHITDTFTGTKSSRTEVLIPEGLRPGETRTVAYEAICDAGMGPHTFGPLRLEVADPLGIFAYEITEKAHQDFQTYPRIEALPEQRIDGSPDSHHFGNLDVMARGHSTNFCGIHEYRRGDSLRKVAWKVSIRNQKLMVKDFEKVTNAEITLVMDMNPLQHGGVGSDSTWEQAKDAALAIAAQQLPLGNSVQLLSQGVRIPFGKGDAHFDRLASELFPSVPWRCRGALSTLPAEEIPRGSSVFLFLPFARNDAAEAAPFVQRLLARDITVRCVLFHSLTYALPKVHGTTLGAVTMSFPLVDQALREFVHQLKHWDVPVHLLTYGTSIQDAFLAKPAKKVVIR